MGDDHDPIAERPHLLHDMTREQNAVAFVPEASQEPTQTSHRHHIQPIGRLVEEQVAGTMNERTRQRGFDPLSLRKAFRNAVREFLHFQQFDQFCSPRGAVGTRQPVQRTEVRNVFTRREVLIDACGVRQHTDATPDFQRIAHGADAVYDGVAGIGGQHGVQDPQCRGFAGAVRAEQSRNAAVLRAHAHIAHGRNGSEVLLQVSRVDHDVRGRVRSQR